jgi:hypothetical protein
MSAAGQFIDHIEVTSAVVLFSLPRMLLSRSFSATKRVAAMCEEEDRVFLLNPKETEHAALVAFLLAKDIAGDVEESEQRVSKFKQLVQRGNSGPSGERLNRMVLETELGCMFREPHQDSFTCFQDTHPEWGAGRSYVTFRDHPQLGKAARVPRAAPEERALLHSRALCAAALSGGHAALRGGADAGRGRVHAAPNGRQDADGPRAAKQLLQDILLPDSNILEVRQLADLPQQLEKLGPALVSSFRVEKRFMADDDFRFTESTIGEKVGLHAMALVGYRKEGSDLRFLIQNRWVSKPFVEVSQEYLLATHAKIYFVTTPQHSIPWSFTNSLDLVEWEMPDTAEQSKA